MTRAPYAERLLGIVVSTAPERGDLDRAIAIAEAARELGAEVGMFFMHHAVAGLVGRREELIALACDGVDLVACGSSAEALGASEDELPCRLGSQDDHAALVSRAERIVALT